MTSYYNYFDILTQIEPLDLIAFRGGELISDFIAILEHEQVGYNEFTHVGLVVTSEILPNTIHLKNESLTLTPGKKYILESTFSYKIASDGVPDELTKHGWLGVQIRDLEQLIPRYITSNKTKIALCKLINNPFHKSPLESNESYTSRKNILIYKFENLFLDYIHRPYELSFINLFSSMFPILRNLRNNITSIYSKCFNIFSSFGLCQQRNCPSGWQFCSELVANFYIQLGIIDNTFDPRDVLPVDYFGYDSDGIPRLVQKPIYFLDWDIPNSPAIIYPPTTT